MKLLYSNILPLGTEDNQETISDRFLEEISSSDVVEIAVGYVSKAALQELEQMVDAQKIRRIVLTIGKQEKYCITQPASAEFQHLGQTCFSLVQSC